MLAVGREGHIPYSGSVALEAAQLLASCHIPQPCNLIVTSSQQILAVGRQSHRNHLGPLVESVQFVASRYIPHARGPVAAARKHVTSIRREGDATHPATMREDVQLLAGLDIPQSGRGITAIAARDRILAIR